MVDKNGKLFGKINLIDFIIVLVILALVAFVALKVVDKGNEGANLTQVRISFYGEETPNYVTKYIEKGTTVLDGTEKVNLGTIESFDIGSPLSYATTTNGDVQQVIKEGYSSVSITAIVKGELGEHGVTVDGVLYGVGHTLPIYAGKAKLFMKVSGIEAVS